ncbi:MAG: porin family protein [Cellvibrionaceae bacterium]|nr:porin family protein [Cellvibrionaceae bacterium]
MFYRFIPCLLAVLISQSAVAQYENYLGLGGAYVEYDDGRSGSVDMGAAVLNLGLDYNEKVTLETRFGASLTRRNFESSTIAADGTVDARRDLDYLVGVYVKFSPFEYFVSPYVIGGYSVARTSLSYLDVHEKTKDDSGSLGVGVDLCRGAYCGTLEAIRYINERERVLDAFSVSFVYRY